MEREQHERSSYWAVIPGDVLFDPELPDSAKALYAVVSTLTHSTGYCYASNSYLASQFKWTERTVQNHLRALERRGYIRIQDGDGGAGRRKIYAGVNPLAGNHEKFFMVTENRENSFGVTTKNLSGSNDNNKANNPPKAPKGAEGEIWDPDAFAAFWALYPKKKDKVKAIREWNKLKADRKLMMTMSAALGRQMASEEWQRDNGRAIPYPCRWLSHRRWEDELEVTIPPVSKTDTREDVPWI